MKFKFIYLLLIVTLSWIQVNAGNPDRIGTSGAAHLQINPFARSSGWGNSNSAGVKGIESAFLNIAGLSFTQKTEIMFNHTLLFQGTGQSINSLGFSQAVGDHTNQKGGVIGVYIHNYSSGDIIRTTYSQPEGGLGTFNYQALDLGIGYAKKFSKSIYGGMNVKVISMGTSDLNATGISIDAGVQYKTSSRKSTEKLKGQDVKFGISIRNVGPDMAYKGDGLTLRGTADDKTYSQTLEQRSAGFNLPSLVNIGASYDMKLDKTPDAYFHRLTIAANFTSNSFSNDQTSIGLEYAYKNFLMVRAGYNYEKNINNQNRETVFSGYCTGLSLDIPFGKNKASTLTLDYSYRLTQVWNGVHTLGLRMNLGSKADDDD